MALGATDPQLVLKTTPPRIPKTVLERTRLGSGLAEFAEKSVITLQAAAGSGKTSLLAQWRTDARVVMHLPPEAFVPPPKIHSAVVHLTALPEPRYLAEGGYFWNAGMFVLKASVWMAALQRFRPDIATATRAAWAARSTDAGDSEDRQDRKSTRLNSSH